MVRPDVAAARVTRAQAWLSRADGVFRLPGEDFVVDTKGRAGLRGVAGGHPGPPVVLGLRGERRRALRGEGARSRRGP
jgi:hypothetical protein